MKKTILLFLFSIISAAGFSQAHKITIDSEAVRKNYAKKVTVSPTDKSVSIKNNVINISPKKEEVIYTISGYYNGQIINKTKNTVLKFKNAYIENNNGQPAIYSEVKLELSAAQGTENYIISSGERLRDIPNKSF